MTITVYPAPAAGGGVKSVQRGLASAAGTVTITAVDIAKSFVTVFGTTSSGSAVGSGTIGAAGASSDIPVRGSGLGLNPNTNANLSLSGSTITGGTTNLVTAVVQGYLNSSTQLIVSGPCRWEVVESF